MAQRSLFSFGVSMKRKNESESVTDAQEPAKKVQVTDQKPVQASRVFENAICGQHGPRSLIRFQTVHYYQYIRMHVLECKDEMRSVKEFICGKGLRLTS